MGKSKTAKDGDSVKSRIQATFEKFNKGELPGENMFPQTNQGMTIQILKNPEKAPNVGKVYGQDVEPGGFYCAPSSGFTPKGWQTGTVHFKKPLIIEVELDTLISWKKDLSSRYQGRRGKDLTEALKEEGYDGIVTRYKAGDLGEVIAFDNARVQMDQITPNKSKSR